MREDVAKSKTHGSDIGLVDVGCNIGLFTLTAALNGYRVLAIDAMNSSLQLVATSLRLANLTSRVTMLHNAISDRHRDVVVQVRLPNNIGASWVLQASSDKDNNTQNVDTQTVVKAICLDDLVDYVPTRRIFLKMDIEASEWLALRCADRFFSELDVPYFHMEWFFYTTKAHHQHGAEIVSYLTKRGYQAFHPNDRVRALSVTIPIKWPPNIIWIKR
ncbi:hypothetical protein BaRGS_00036890 [Batillaria attramentaria]|uniref:Methyltransferase FkbM domain-containing protein n=1 Tax=Batillaria attramentaria TaxID=370345 RepID=A0ABD0JAC4_9CAEN